MLTVAMITRNEEAAVAKVVGDIRAAVPEAEVLIVDSSSDRTAEIAEGLGARVIKQFPAKGYGAAMDLALRSARGSVIVTMDCDDTYPSEMIAAAARLVSEQGYDIVDCSRLKSKPTAMPWINYLANYAFALLASALFARRITDLHSGMRAYRKGVVEEVACDPFGPALPVELLLRPLALGYRIGVLFIDYKPRIGESTLDPLPSAVWTLRRILRARFETLRRTGEK